MVFCYLSFLFTFPKEENPIHDLIVGKHEIKLGVYVKLKVHSFNAIFHGVIVVLINPRLQNCLNNFLCFLLYSLNFASALHEVVVLFFFCVGDLV